MRRARFDSKTLLGSPLALLTSFLFFLVAGLSCADEEKPALNSEQPSSTQLESSLNPALTNPSLANEQAPEQFKVEFNTTKGKIILEIHRPWSPHGADRFYNLVKIGYFEDIGFIRAIEGFMVQFGIHGNPKVSGQWHRASILDDSTVESNLRGTISFAKTNQPNSRTTQLFMNLSDNKNLDRMGFSPFGKIVEGLDVLDALHKTGEGAPGGPGPSQQKVRIYGNEYLRQSFPKLDYLESARILD